MSIIITGMDMPTSRCAVTLKVWPDGEVEIIDEDGEWKVVKAIPVPPHGRLGDLDELKVKIKKEDSGYELNSFGDGMWTAFQSVYRCIDAAPTVIPADPAKDGET